MGFNSGFKGLNFMYGSGYNCGVWFKIKLSHISFIQIRQEILEWKYDEEKEIDL